MTDRRGPEYQPSIGRGKRFAVVAGLTLTVACQAEIQPTPTTEIFPTQPQVTEIIPVPVPSDLTFAGVPTSGADILAAFGQAVGAGGPLPSTIEKVFNNGNLQAKLNEISLAPLLDFEGGVSQISKLGDQRLCFPNMPPALFNPNVVSGQDSWLEANGFIISYGEKSTQEVRFKGLGAVSLKETNQDLICVNAVINNPNNPFRDKQGNPEKPGKLLNALMDRNTGEIYGTLPGIYGAEEDVRFDFSTGQVVVGNTDVWYIGDKIAELVEKPLTVKIPEALDNRWVQMGYLKDLREGGRHETVSMEINGERREFLGWRIGFTEILVDKEFVDMDASFGLGRHKYSGVTIIPNPNEENAEKAIEKFGAWIHAINLGILDRVEEDFDPNWYPEYLKFISENPNATYELEGNLPVPGKRGAYRIGTIGTVNPSLPARFVVLPPVMEKEYAMDRADRIIGGHPQSPFGLGYLERYSGYYDLEIGSQGKLSILMSGWLKDNKISMDQPVPHLVDALSIASNNLYYRSAFISPGPGDPNNIFTRIFRSSYEDPYNGAWQRPHFTWGYP